ncbi:MAG: glycerol kinase [Nitrospinota bacterium]|nr:MAG: glycerol kinase [Nitrospinota bacterium]
MTRYILALDQGTTSSRAILFTPEGKVLTTASREITQHYPQPGWVEHDPWEIWESQRAVAYQVIEQAGIGPRDIAAIGITNQRETTILWERESGTPIGNAIVWQCRRSAPICQRLQQAGYRELIRAKTGLVIDAYFSATKIMWALEQVPGLRQRAERGEICFGTVDSWLIYQLTGGRLHVTDYSNASRTMLYNIYQLDWDEELLRLMQIPSPLLPEVRPSSGVYGTTAPQVFDGVEIPISGVAGDQQAALFGQACFTPGSTKNTYGTGCFVLMNTGTQGIASPSGLVTTLAWGIGDEVSYALEGSIFIAGAAIQWLRDELQILPHAAESEALARAIPDTQGVYFVPAFVGLGAPHWDMYARGALLGLTRGTNRRHIVRAALEAIAYQTRDVLECMQQDAHIPVQELRVDGGATTNDFLLQFQADILNVPVLRTAVAETTAQGAAFLAGLGVGYWKDQEEIAQLWQEERRFLPQMDDRERERLYQGWQKAVERAKAWAGEQG